MSCEPTRDLSFVEPFLFWIVSLVAALHLSLPFRAAALIFFPSQNVKTYFFPNMSHSFPTKALRLSTPLFFCEPPLLSVSY